MLLRNHGLEIGPKDPSWSSYFTAPFSAWPSLFLLTWNNGACIIIPSGRMDREPIIDFALII